MSLSSSVAPPRLAPQSKERYAPRSAVVAAPMIPQLTAAVWSIAPSDYSPIGHAFLVTQGKALFGYDHAAVLDLNAPTLLWLPRSVRGTFRLDAGSQGFTCAVAEEFVWRTLGHSAMLATLRPMLDGIAVASSDRLAPGLEELEMVFAALVRESRDAQAGATAIMGFHLGLLLMHLWRASAAAPKTDVRGTRLTTVQRFRQLIELHYRENLGIADFADLLGVTRTHLNDACLKATAKTPLILVHDRLIEEARLRLEQTDLPVEQVGYSLGFRDAGYFNRFFKRVTGVSPGVHRKAATSLRPANETPSFAAWP